MGRGRHARRSGSGGGGSRSGRSSAGHGLSRTEQQEELVRNFPRPTAAYVYPISHGRSGSGSGSDDGYYYQYDECQYRLNQVYDAVRLCGSDCTSATMHLAFLKNVCGIRVVPERLENEASASASASANRRTKK